MDSKTKPMRLEEVDWLNLFPWLRLARALRMALHPPKLLLCLLLVLLLFLGGWVLDASLPGRPVYPGEVNQFATRTPAMFESWIQVQPDSVLERLREDISVLIGPERAAAVMSSPEPFRVAVEQINQHYEREFQIVHEPRLGLSADERAAQSRNLRQQRADHLWAVRRLRPRGPFAAALEAELSGFEKLVRSVIALDFGLHDLITDGSVSHTTVVGALRQMLLTVPAWLWDQYRTFLALYGIFGLALWSILGGAVARMAALHACRDQRVSATDAVVFATRRWVGFVGALLLPLLLIAALGTLLALSGLIFYNIPGLDVVGAVLFGLSILLGGLIALLLTGWLLGLPLYFPALAVEGSDAFDIVSRCMNYVIGRPLAWVFYNALALLYGAVCYMIAAALMFLALWMTRVFISVGVFRQAGMGVDRFEAMLPDPKFGALSYNVDLWLLGLSGKIAAVMISIWVYACIGLLAAFAISYFLSANTWIYLLLRRHADGTEFDEVALEKTPAPAVASPEAAALNPDVSVS